MKNPKFQRIKKFPKVIVSLIVFISIFTSPGFTPSARATTCASPGVDITALHRPSSDAWGARRPFYADSSGGVNGKNSGYVGYAVDGTSVSSVTDLWVKLSGFTGGYLNFGTNQSSVVPIRSKFKAANGTDHATKRVVYIYLKSSYSGQRTTTDQTFTIELYNGNPNLGGTQICTATDGFSGVEDITSANANKITSVSTTATTVVLGSNFEVTAIGQTGTMSDGINDDQVTSGSNTYGVLAISASITDTWNADAFTLTGVSYVIDSNRNGSYADETTNYNLLRYYPTSTVNQKYRVVYYFSAREVIASTLFQPVQSIASGNAVKYTASYSGTASSTSISIVKNSLSLNKALKSITSQGTSGSNNLYDLSYRLTLKNIGSTTSVFDYIQDTVTLNSGTTGGSFVSPTNGSTLTLDGTSSITPTTHASISSSVLTLNFNGPITLTSGQTSNIDYTIRISYPTSNSSMPISNTAVGYIGTEQITSSTGVNAVGINIVNTNTLTIEYSSSGYVTVDAKQVNGTDCSSQSLASGSVVCTFYRGTPLTLTAVSAQSISSWAATANGHASNTGDCSTSNANSPCTMVLNADAVITPVFNVSYTVTIVGVSNVAVSDSKLPYSCSSGTCTKSYAAGSTASLTFTPDTGYSVSAITSNASGTSSGSFTVNGTSASTGSITVNSSFTITVTANLPNYGLDVSATIGGSVSNTSPATTYISSCSSNADGATGTCGDVIPSGTSVTLTASVSAGYYFGGWGGDGSCTGTSLTCTFTMNQNRTVSATFTSSPSLVVTVVGSGTVSANSGSITDCDSNGLACSSSYTLNSSVTLTATPTAGYALTWSDACSGSSSTCTLTMNASKAVTATFTAINYTITIASVTGGSGSSSAATVTYNGSVTLTATASAGYNFTSWSCTVGTLANSASSSTTLSAITANTTCTPTFTAINYTITIASVTGGSGSSSAATVTYNGSVTLSATASSGYVFTSWSCTVGTLANSASSSTTLSAITANTTCTPTFTVTYTVTIGALTNGTGSSISVATSPSISGATITLTISPASGNRLKANTLVATPTTGSNPTISGSGNTYTFTMPSQNVVVTAEFEAIPAGSYSITINSATGGSGSSSAATVTSGGSVTLTATPSSGYTFTSWSCTGGGSLDSSTANPATLSNITADATCTPTFTATSSSGGARNTAPTNNSASKKIVITKVSNETNPQTSNNQKLVFIGTNSTFTPGNSANKISGISNSASTSTSSNGGVVVVVTNTTQAQSQSQSAPSSSAEVSAINTTTETEVSRNSNVPEAVTVNRNEGNGKLAVTATNGWTGRLSVAVVDTTSGEAVESFVEIVIAPTPAESPIVNYLPPANPFGPPAPATPNKPTINTGITINWQPSQSEVTGYVVTVNEKVACTSSTTSCVVNQIIGPKSKVEVYAQGNDNTFSPPVVVPEFKPAAPIPGLVVYFPLASSKLTKPEVKKLDEFVAAMRAAGLNRVELQGHTDIQGTSSGYDNQTLSKNRADIVASYLRKNLKVITRKDQFADTKPAVLGTGEPVFKNNRRTEVLVW